MKNPATPLGIVAVTQAIVYVVSITSPNAGASLSPASVVAVSFSISPSAPSATARLYDGETLVGTATVSGTSGTVTSSAPLTEGTRSLTVVLTVGTATHTSAALSVTVRPATVAMTIGAAFAAMAQSSGSDLWTFPDTTTATTETVDYTGTAGTATLRSTGITSLDFGYNAGDGGDTWDTTGTWNAALETYGRDATSVTAISGLSDGAPGLQRFYASGTSLASIDFSGLSALRVAEFYYAANASGNVSAATFSGCTSLLRVCFENANLASLDLSDATGIVDIRGRGQRGGAVDFALTIGSTAALQHLCIGSCNSTHSVLGIDGILTGAVACPMLREFWTWVCNRPVLFAPNLGGGSGVIVIDSRQSLHTGLDTSNISWPASGNNILDIGWNPLATCVISELTAARCPTLNLANCGMTQTLVDHVLEMYANHSALTTGSIDISGNAVPSAAGIAHAETIRARGMTVSVAT